VPKEENSKGGSRGRSASIFCVISRLRLLCRVVCAHFSQGANFIVQSEALTSRLKPSLLVVNCFVFLHLGFSPHHFLHSNGC
jgi:hypothetical protein